MHVSWEKKKKKHAQNIRSTVHRAGDLIKRHKLLLVSSKNWITTGCLQFSACSERPIRLNSSSEILKMFRTPPLTKKTLSKQKASILWSHHGETRSCLEKMIMQVWHSSTGVRKTSTCFGSRILRLAERGASVTTFHQVFGVR